MLVLVVLVLVSAWDLTWTLQMEKVDDEDILHTFLSLFCMIIHTGIFFFVMEFFRNNILEYFPS